MNKRINTNKPLSSRNTEGYYIPDEFEKINDIEPDNTYENETEERLEDAFFNSINKVINNNRELKSSTNYGIAMSFLKQLKKTNGGIKVTPEERIKIVREALNTSEINQGDTLCNHFTNLTETLFNHYGSERYRLLTKLVEYPLECASSYVQETTNSDSFLRRKYYDGQTRKRKDGSTYQREINIVTEADTIYAGEDGKEYSPMQMVEFNDKYFNNIDDFLSQLSDDEKKVARCMMFLSLFEKKVTIKELVEYTNFTKRQIETLKEKLRYKALIWLKDSERNDDYNQYYNLCKKKKNFDENYKKFIKM